MLLGELLACQDFCIQAKQAQAVLSVMPDVLESFRRAGDNQFGITLRRRIDILLADNVGDQPYGIDLRLIIFSGFIQAVAADHSVDTERRTTNAAEAAIASRSAPADVPGFQHPGFDLVIATQMIGRR